MALTSQKARIHKSWKDRRLSDVRTQDQRKSESGEQEHKKRERERELKQRPGVGEGGKVPRTSRGGNFVPS